MNNIAINLDKNLALELQWIPPGEFLMGSPETEDGHESSESPEHKVRLTHGFWMGKYPVIQQQWQAIMNSNPSKFVDPHQPVEMVSWNDAQEFISRLNKLGRGSFRLPTEAEWEYACRGETTTRFCSGDDEHGLTQVAWFAANSNGHPHPAGTKEPNAFGLYDMHGNVFEWVSDWDGPYSPDDSIDPAGPPTGSKRVLRGGCCLCNTLNCRTANRYSKAPDGKNINIGFRVIMVETA
jgi:formylglycine-generating enzyme required for sulfatase activity